MEKITRGKDEATTPLPATTYNQVITRARKEYPALIKRMSNWLFAAKFDPTNSLHNQYLGMPFKGQ